MASTLSAMNAFVDRLALARVVVLDDLPGLHLAGAARRPGTGGLPRRGCREMRSQAKRGEKPFEGSGGERAGFSIFAQLLKGDVVFIHYDPRERYNNPRGVSEVVWAYDRFNVTRSPGKIHDVVGNWFGRLVGDWSAFAEMSALGWIDPVKRPHMVTVQAANCAPIVRAYDEGTEKARPWEGATTIADGLRVPRAIGDFLVLRAVRDSGGAAVSVPDADMVTGMKDLGRYEGISAAPEGGAALQALRVLQAQGRITADDTVVVFNTGGALKYLDVLG